MTDPSGQILDISTDKLETSEKACRMKYGFEAGSVDSYIDTLIRCGREYREWSLDEAEKGNHARAFIYHRMAEDNLASVKWWMARNEFYGEAQ